MKEVFTEIYERRGWGDGESVSGPGSGVERTSVFRGELSALLISLNARTLLDAGCGDFNWMKEMHLELERYIGIDIVPGLIAENERTYASPARLFLERNIATDPLPQADVILSRDCLVHLSLGEIAATIRNFTASGSTYLLATTFIDWPVNTEIRTGEWRRLNMQRPPFNFPAPLFLVDEHCTHTGGIYTDKRFGLWPLRDIPSPEVP